MLTAHPHRRLNILTGEWVLVSPHRTSRPWQGQLEKANLSDEPGYDENCYLCPGNSRAGGAQNPEYASTFYFDNDFAALYLSAQSQSQNEQDLLVAQSESGICRVICFSPKHNLTLARMTQDEISPVVDLWSNQFAELAAVDLIRSVQIFENRGEMMGSSNPHPHCQIWASESIPNELAKEIRSFEEHRTKAESCLLCDYLTLELETDDRVVLDNEHFVVLVPFWAVYPFETIVLPRRHFSGLDELNDAEKGAMADILHRLSVRYDNLFRTSFPYSMGFHLRPTDGRDFSFFHAHVHFYPPLLRSATVRKFHVGFEILGSPQRDFTPESAAERLRELSETHYLS